MIAIGIPASRLSLSSGDVINDRCHILVIHMSFKSVDTLRQEQGPLVSYAASIWITHLMPSGV